MSLRVSCVFGSTCDPLLFYVLITDYLSGEIHIGGQEHFYLETQVTLAVPLEDGEMELFVSTQAPSDSQVISL